MYMSSMKPKRGDIIVACKKPGVEAEIEEVNSYSVEEPGRLLMQLVIVVFMES